MSIGLALLVFMHLLLPAFLVWLAGWSRGQTQLGVVLRLLLAAAYAIHVFLAGRWDWFGYYLRYALLLMVVGAAIVGWRRAQALPVWPRNKLTAWFSPLVFGLVGLSFAAAVATYAPFGYAFEGQAVALTFPLENGRFYVTQGGNRAALNHHHGHAAQRYALDVVELNAAGLRADGFYPQSLSGYRIFGEPVVAPCSGSVSAIENSRPDLLPPARDAINPAGNHVVISCNGASVLLAHLQQGSVQVEPGANVRTGQPIGRVGNSGNTSEPHLHIHAVRSGSAASLLGGEAMPMVFDGRFLARNSVVHAD